MSSIYKGKIGEYKILEQKYINEERTKVHLAEETSSKKKLIVKFLLKNDDLASITTEIDVMIKADCPFIIKYIDSIFTDLNIGIVMEYCQNGDLSSRIGKKNDQETIFQWLTETVIGTNYLHSKNIIHRDIKPGNIFLTSDYHVKLGDLGSARSVSTTDIVRGGISTIAGTRAFMPPEGLYDNSELEKLTNSLKQEWSHLENEELKKLRITEILNNLIIFKNRLEYLSNIGSKFSALNYKAKKNIFFIGSTGSGKSTLINYLIGHTLQCQKKNLTIKKSSSEIEILVDERKSKDYAKISNKIYSETKSIKPYQSSDNPETIYWDFPGFFDTDGNFEQIQNAYLMKAFSKEIGNFNIVLVVEYACFETERGINFTKLTKLMSQLFSDNQLKNNISIVITKVDTESDNHQETLNEILDENGILFEIKRQNSFLKIFTEKEELHKKIAIFTRITHKIPFPNDFATHLKNSIFKSEFVTNSSLNLTPGDESSYFVRKLSDFFKEYVKSLLRNFVQFKQDTIRDLILDQKFKKSDLISSFKFSLNDIIKHSNKTFDILFFQDLQKTMHKSNRKEDALLLSKINELFIFFQSIVPDLILDSDGCINIMKSFNENFDKLIEVPQPKRINKSTLQIAVPIITTSELNNLNYYSSEINSIQIKSRLFILDEDLTELRGVSLSMSVPEWRVLGDRIINLSGDKNKRDSGGFYSEPSLPKLVGSNVTFILNGFDGENGKFDKIDFENEAKYAQDAIDKLKECIYVKNMLENDQKQIPEIIANTTIDKDINRLNEDVEYLSTIFFSVDSEFPFQINSTVADTIFINQYKLLDEKWKVYDEKLKENLTEAEKKILLKKCLQTDIVIKLICIKSFELFLEKQLKNMKSTSIEINQKEQYSKEIRQLLSKINTLEEQLGVKNSQIPIKLYLKDNYRKYKLSFNDCKLYETIKNYLDEIRNLSLQIKEQIENKEMRRLEEKIKDINAVFLSRFYVIDKVEISGYDIVESLKEYKSKQTELDKKNLEEKLEDFNSKTNNMKKDFQMIGEKYNNLIELEKKKENNLKKLKEFSLRKHEIQFNGSQQLFQMIEGLFEKIKSENDLNCLLKESCLRQMNLRKRSENKFLLNSNLTLAKNIIDSETNMVEKQNDKELHSLLIEKIRMDMLIELFRLKKEIYDFIKGSKLLGLYKELKEFENSGEKLIDELINKREQKINELKKNKFECTSNDIESLKIVEENIQIIKETDHQPSYIKRLKETRDQFEKSAKNYETELARSKIIIKNLKNNSNRSSDEKEFIDIYIEFESIAEQIESQKIDLKLVEKILIRESNRQQKFKKNSIEHIFNESFYEVYKLFGSNGISGGNSGYCHIENNSKMKIEKKEGKGGCRFIFEGIYVSVYSKICSRTYFRTYFRTMNENEFNSFNESFRSRSLNKDIYWGYTPDTILTFLLAAPFGILFLGVDKLRSKAEEITGGKGKIIVRGLSAIPYFVTAAGTLLGAAIGAIPALVADGFRMINGSFWIYGPFISEEERADNGRETFFKKEELLLPNQKLEEEALSFFPKE